MTLVFVQILLTHNCVRLISTTCIKDVVRRSAVNLLMPRFEESLEAVYSCVEICSIVLFVQNTTDGFCTEI